MNIATLIGMIFSIIVTFSACSEQKAPSITKIIPFESQVVIKNKHTNLRNTEEKIEESKQLFTKDEKVEKNMAFNTISILLMLGIILSLIWI